MDHFFEQKTLRENQELNKQVFALNKQIKQLQEKVLTYEQLLNELNVLGAMKSGAGAAFDRRYSRTRQGEKLSPTVTGFSVMGGALAGAARAITHNIRTRGVLGGTVSRSAALEAGREGASRLGTIGHMQSLRRGAEARSELGLPSGAGAGQVADKLRYDDGNNPKLNAILAGTERAERRIERSQKAVAKIDRMRGLRPPLSESHTKKELLQIKDSKGGRIRLRGLVDEYKGKIQDAANDAERKKHRDEIATIRDMLKNNNSTVSEGLLDDLANKVKSGAAAVGRGVVRGAKVVKGELTNPNSTTARLAWSAARSGGMRL